MVLHLRLAVQFPLSVSIQIVDHSSSLQSDSSLISDGLGFSLLIVSYFQISTSIHLTISSSIFESNQSSFPWDIWAQRHSKSLIIYSAHSKYSRHIFSALSLACNQDQDQHQKLGLFRLAKHQFQKRGLQNQNEPSFIVCHSTLKTRYGPRMN